MAINLCHGLSVIGGGVDTGDKFITCVVDTAEQLSPVSLSPAINLSLVIIDTTELRLPVTTTPAINFSPVLMAPVNNYRR
jgi:hypothetical protein